MKCLAAVGFLLLLCLGGCGSESGQPDVATDGIILERRFSIGSLEDFFTPDLETEFAVTDSYLVAGGGRGLIYVFDLDGKPLRELNLFGQGPGEISGSGSPFAIEGDSVMVVDRASGRIVAIDLTTDSVRAVGALGAQYGELALGSGGWVASAYARLDWIPHGGEPTTLASFTPDEANTNGPAIVGWAGPNLVWSPKDVYRVSWGEPGTTLQAIAHEPSHFTVPVERPAEPGRASQRPWIVRIAPGDDDHAWIVSVTPTGVEGPLTDMYTTHVELLNVRTGMVAADTALAGMYSITRDGRWLYEFDATGSVPRLHFLRISTSSLN